MVRVTYIWHDCFLVETPSASLVFDYWLDGDALPAKMPREVADLPSDKPLYIFVSHGHKDHYNPAIFGWASRFADIRYVVSHDVSKRIRHILSPTSVYSGPKVSPERVWSLRRNESASDGRVSVFALPSTDIGNSYMVEVDGIRIFHAGDLNAWHWKDESTPEEINKAMGDYRACLRDVEAMLHNRAADAACPCSPDVIDYCFFPVDSRIGTDYFDGAQMLLRRINVRRFFPMHIAVDLDPETLQRRREDAMRVELYANPDRGEVIPLLTPHSSYTDPE